MRLQKWIERNLDSLYSRIDRQRLQNYSNQKACGKIEFNKYKSNKIYKDKNTFKKNLLEMFEKIVDQKLNKNNYRRLMALKAHMEKNNDYQNKSAFVDKHIEKRIKFLAPSKMSSINSALGQAKSFSYSKSKTQKSETDFTEGYA